MATDEQYKRLKKIHDPGLAAALILNGFLPLFTGVEQEGQIVFGFKKTEKLEEVVSGYWGNTLKIAACEFFNTTQIVMGMAYGSRELTCD